MERIQSGGSEELGDDLEEYDPVAAAREDADAIRRVVESPDVDPQFKERVLAFAEARRRDLDELGNPEAAAHYDIAV